MDEMQVEEIMTIKRVLGFDIRDLDSTQMQYVIGACAAYVEDTREKVDSDLYGALRLSISLI